MAQTLKIGGKSLSSENWKVYHPDGKHMFTCGVRKKNWYVNKNLAIIKEDEENAIVFTFEPKGSGYEEHETFGLAGRIIRCVVSSKTDGLQRHHIVPYCYRKFLPEEYKSKNHHDVVLVTYKVHEQYERFADIFKNDLAKEYDVPTLNELNLQYTKLICEYSSDKVKMLSRFFSLFKCYNTIPREQIIEILEHVSNYCDISHEKLCTLNYMQLYKLYSIMKKRHEGELSYFKEKNKKKI